MLLGIVQILLDVLWWIIIIQFVLSILISFNVINTYNEVVAGLYQGLNRLTEPLFAPIRRVLPDTRPLDLAPLAVLVAMSILNRAIIPWLAGAIASSGM
ncbi:YggT family protein [Sphingomonas sp. BGYR3]|uniref:YggT family protein n=1 Tax=Sphingomonas sp. BGYR3 TaxID=2975483 RepID=UPI0021A6AA1C|nr:YggT family protein [Sphingomonas sp. BGYR3]MDG5487908.1 YggT family protein [Sphingomonas sp. BGYR3]